MWPLGQGEKENQINVWLCVTIFITCFGQRSSLSMCETREKAAKYFEHDVSIHKK